MVTYHTGDLLLVVLLSRLTSLPFIFFQEYERTVVQKPKWCNYGMMPDELRDFVLPVVDCRGDYTSAFDDDPFLMFNAEGFKTMAAVSPLHAWHLTTRYFAAEECQPCKRYIHCLYGHEVGA